MAFRRRFRKRFRSFRRPHGIRLRTPRETTRFEMGQVAVFQNGLVNDAAQSQLFTVVLAQIPNRVGDTTTGQGRALNSIARRMEIGGVVLSYAVRVSGSAIQPDDPASAIVENMHDHQLLVCSDRLFADGLPSAVNTDWFTATTPMSIASAQTVEDEQPTYPLRVHFRDCFFDHRSRTIASGVEDDVAPSLQPVTRMQGRCNLRLRLALEDTHCLVLHLATRITNWDGGTLLYNWTVRGSIYYRVRF